jgi:DNA-binding NarL/FixJ family response regulator
MRPISLLVIDDHPVVHQGVRQLLDPIDGVVIVSEAQNGEDGIAAARRVTADVVLLDARLPDILTADAVRRIGAVSPHSRIVIFTAHGTPTLIEEIRRLGVHGFVRKDSSPDEFVDVILRVASGEVARAPTLFPDDELRRAADKLNGAALTVREYDVLRRAAMGESNAEIGAVLYLAPTTVKSYLQSALHKLDARNRVEAVAKLSELGLL